MEHIVPFEAASPDKLREALARHAVNGRRFAAVRVFGPRILTRVFHFPPASRGDIRSGLSVEASEILSVPARDIAVAYHVNHEGPDGVSGICVAIQRLELEGYLDCFHDNALIPVSLTSAAAASAVDFLRNNPLAGPDHCVVNFIEPNVVGIMVVADGAPALFAEACDLSDEDLQEKIVNTVRYVCSRSVSKRMGQIYVTGRTRGKEGLMEKLTVLPEPAEVQLPAGLPPVAGMKAPDLFGSRVLGYDARAAMVRGFMLITLGCAATGVLLGAELYTARQELNEIRSAVSLNEYHTALELQERIRRLDHGK